MVQNSTNNPNLYEILLLEHIQPSWSQWLQGFEIRWLESGETLLTGAVPDQAALHGLLARIRDLNLTILVIRRVVHPDNEDNIS